MALFDECIEALGKPIILSDFETQKVRDCFLKSFSFSYGRIDWEKVNSKEKIYKKTDILEKIQDHKREFYIIWDNIELPIVKSTIESIVNVLDDVLAVSFDTWIYRPDDGTIIEFYHEGEITISFT